MAHDAGAPDKEVAITPEMIEAACQKPWSLDISDPFDIDRDIMRMILSAALSGAKRTSPGV